MIPTLCTFYGRRLAAQPARIQLSEWADLARLADRLDRLADDRLRDGDPIAADRLTWRAEAVRGVAMAPSSAPEVAV
jgi:hypothetical protein